MILLCLLMLVLGRVVNVLVPNQYKRVVDSLSEYTIFAEWGVIERVLRERGVVFLKTDVEVPQHGDFAKIPYAELMLFVLLRLLQGSVGLIATVQNYCWIPVGQFTTREVSIGMFNHLHRLSHRFHMNRKTGEILRVQAYRRTANALDNAMEARAVDSLLNFETVKLYTAESFEEKMYKTAVEEYQTADFASSMSQSALNMAQTFIIQAGLLVGCLLCAKRIVVDGTMVLGDFVLYLTYITQLYGPLNWFGNYYRVIQKNFVDMEKMLDLFEENVEVQDADTAGPLDVQGGEVVFENVTFAYDPRIPPILQDVSFRVPAGATVALVGPSGGGKSTIFRLILRFYDVQMGRILIDGQDIRSVKQKSLRKAVGVVPQDTVLFNESVHYNVLYGRPEGTGDEVVEAATAAQIHDRIMSFPDGYETRVGERGLRLSGGEKQRVAIARTLLKNPAIVLLDEATSALDNTTERMVQESLRTLCNRRTTIVIAHRLSTVVDADLILVIKNGRVVERGTHGDLLRMHDGEYMKMWLNQLQEEQNGPRVVGGVVVGGQSEMPVVSVSR
ncbi:Homocysteine S-methyltransferase 1 [Dinochytrium kinnereticum]|nr:Homocysteine S-methyltransferase 1 [Dinochytrium kinnereticum]